MAGSVTAIATGSFGIDQHRAGDLDPDESAVDGDVDGVADARAPALEQGQGERARGLEGFVLAITPFNFTAIGATCRPRRR